MYIYEWSGDPLEFLKEMEITIIKVLLVYKYNILDIYFVLIKFYIMKTLVMILSISFEK